MQIPIKTIETLSTLLEEVFLKLKEKCDTKKIAISFSGGLDSSILAHLSVRVGLEPQLYCVGMNGCADFSRSEKVASILNLNVKKICVLPEELVEAIKVIKKICPIFYPNRIVYSVPVYFVAASCTETTVLTGQGADELFCGYLKYLKVDKIERLEHNLELDLEKAIENTEVDRCIANHFQKRLFAPYLIESFMQFAKQLPVTYKINRNIRKYILREMAIYRGLPAEIVWYEKKAAQYSTGMVKTLRKLARQAIRQIKS